MAVVIEHNCALPGRNGELSRRITAFFREQGYTQPNPETLRFQHLSLEARSLIGSQGPAEIKRTAVVTLTPRLTTVQMHLQYRIHFSQKFGGSLDWIYWDLEWRALQTAVQQQPLPDWQSVFAAAYKRYLWLSVAIVLLMMPLTLILPLGSVIFILDRFNSLTSALAAFVYLVTSAIIFNVVCISALGALAASRHSAQKIWRQAQRQSPSETSHE
ncbi:MAG: hypothetical protein GY796_05685 [Chloroflexi bacterium]|nr:hypothetical protein [Chloroflexota bacterium]